MSLHSDTFSWLWDYQSLLFRIYMNQYNLEVMSQLWPWPQRSHNCFQAYLRAFSRSISSFFNLWISKTRFNYILVWPGPILFMSEAANLLEHISSFLVYDIHSQSECSILCYTGFPVLYLFPWYLCMPALIFISDDLYISNKIKSIQIL